jgi:DNA-binding NtrC family response regulator
MSGKGPDLRTQRRPKLDAPPGSPTPFVLTVVEGPNVGVEHMIDPANPTRVLVGKSPACVFHLDDPEVSRRHASVFVRGSQLELIDLGSTNGTTVNGVLIKEAYLVGGEAIRMGATVLSVKRDVPKRLVLGSATRFGRVLGQSTAMRRIFPSLERLAKTSHAVLLEGEPGTGKELVAEELHRAGARAEGPFVVLSTSTLPPEEIVASLRPGSDIVEQARQGTLFVDELGSVPAEGQRLLAKLVAEGASDTGVRVMCATSEILDSDAYQAKFDQDLFVALLPGRLEIPRLREREGDVALLARHFWAELVAPEETPLPEDFLSRFEHYAFPGNVRELAAAVAARHLHGELVSAFKHEPKPQKNVDFITDVTSRDLPFPRARELVVHEFEKRYVERVLERHGGSVAKASAASGVAHRYFQLIKARVK